MISGLYLLVFSREGFVFWHWALAAVHLGLGIWTVLDDQNSRICARMMLDSLENGGRDLAWVYRKNQVLPKGGFQSTLFTFWFTNRRHDSISLDERDVDDMLHFFKYLSSQISIGYSKDLQKIYRKSPILLKTNPQRINGVEVIEVDPSQANGW